MISFLLDSWQTETSKIFERFKQFYPYLSFSNRASQNCIPFLDIKVIMIDGKLDTDLHIKPTIRHQYLRYLSSNPEHTTQQTHQR